MEQMKLTNFLSVITLLVAMTGCTTTPMAGTTPLTPAQVAATVCPTAQLILTDVQSLTTSTAAQKDLATVIPMVNTVCAAGTTVSFASLTSFNSTVMPLLVTLIKESDLDAATQQKDIAAIDVIQMGLALAINVQ